MSSYASDQVAGQDDGLPPDEEVSEYRDCALNRQRYSLRPASGGCSTTPVHSTPRQLAILLWRESSLLGLS